ncbi:hypothetical protein ACFW9V_35655 [Streptomyces hygroscopicus]|uniref:hypothetical protein n=1 Tax=Streptomyces hygroscopicus TaxID=1912 RepID=UPI0036D08DC6
MSAQRAREAAIGARRVRKAAMGMRRVRKTAMGAHHVRKPATSVRRIRRTATSTRRIRKAATGTRRIRKAAAADRALRHYRPEVAVGPQLPQGVPVVPARCGRGGLAALGGPVQIEYVLLGEGHGSTVRPAPGGRHAD